MKITPGRLAVLISNEDAASLRMFVGKDQEGKKYVELTGENDREIEIDKDGFGVFEVGPGSLCAWADKDSL